MENYITPVRIANSIEQDTSFDGTYLMLEGTKDLKLFKKFSCEEKSKIKITHGKYKMRETYEILKSRNFFRVVGIRDADYIRLKENIKYNPNYEESIFITDTHDSEGMIVKSKALTDLLIEIADENRLNLFVEQHGDIRLLLFSLAYPLACLRLANKRFSLGLSFKPRNPEGPVFKIKKFICEKTISYIGDDELINTIVEYSKNRNCNIKDRAYIKSCLDVILAEGHPSQEIINGHDLAEILFIICKKGLRSSSKTLHDASCVEELLRLSYTEKYFEETELFLAIRKLQDDRELSFLIPK